MNYISFPNVRVECDFLKDALKHIEFYDEKKGNPVCKIS